MKGTPFLVQKPHHRNARKELQNRSREKWPTAYPIAVLGPVVIPWGWLLPRFMLPSDARIKKWNAKCGYKDNESNVPSPATTAAKPELPRKRLSTYPVDATKNQDCKLLKMLPLELRREIYAWVLGRDSFRLVTVPWKVTTLVDKPGNVSMRNDCFAYGGNDMAINPVQGCGNALLMTCVQVYQEAIEIMYSTNTFIFPDFATLFSFSKTVPTQRLNAIRTLKIHYSPTKSVPYPHTRTEHYDLPCDLGDFWEIVVNMKGLRHLDLDLEAYYMNLVNYDHERHEIDRLSPLLRLRGMETFHLDLGYIGHDSVVRYEIYAPRLRKELMEVVRRPRGE